MNKTEFVDALAAKTGFTKKDSQTAVNAFLGLVEDAMRNGESVQFVGFGTFEPKQKKEKTAINPQTKEKIQVPARIVPSFKAGQKLKDAANQK